VFLDRRLVELVGLALDDLDRVLRAVAQAGPESVTVDVRH
jgi:hypothetical protein